MKLKKIKLFLCVFFSYFASFVDGAQFSTQSFLDEQTVQRAKQQAHCLGTIFTGPQNFAFCNSLSSNKNSGQKNVWYEKEEMDILDEPLGNVTKCEADLLWTLFRLDEPWAKSMLDATAKPPSGILQGKVLWLGDFYECINASAPPSGDFGGFSGQYCTFGLQLGSENASLAVSTGVCVPDTCTSDELLNLTRISLLRNFLLGNGSIFSVSTITCQPKHIPWDGPAIAMLFLISLFAALAAVGTAFTLYEILRERLSGSSDEHKDALPFKGDTAINHDDATSHGEENDRSTLVEGTKTPNSAVVQIKKFFRCFCVITNGTKILDTSNKGEFLSVHGIRFLSMTWVILGHTYAFVMNAGASFSMLEAFKRTDSFAFQVILRGPLSVDSFFLLSGFLLTYLFLKEATKKEGKINWVLYYFHRYWRLTPVYAIVLGFDFALTKYVGSGPSWPSEGNEQICKDQWWWNLLYINNLPSQDGLCMGWSWFLANDMQFYVISPIFLYCLWRWPKIGLSIVSTLLVGSWITSGIISWHYKFFAGIAAMPRDENLLVVMVRMKDYFQQFYIKPYTRIGPYLVGVLLGYIIFQHKGKKKFLPIVYQVCGWFLATAVSLTVIYGLYRSSPSVELSALYNALSSSLFTASLAWVIFTCVTGQGGPVNKILSYELFIPLSRLTYCAYLLHPIIIYGYYQSLESPPHATHMATVSLFLGFLVMSYAAAFVTSLVFEAPFMAIEKLFIKRT